MKKIEQIICCVQLGGLRLLFLKIHDKISGGNKSHQYIYSKSVVAKPQEYERLLCLIYGIRTGKKLNLQEPNTFNEKIQWMKLFDTTALKTKLADKWMVREWIAEKIGENYLIPLLGVWDRFEDIDIKELLFY